MRTVRVIRNRKPAYPAIDILESDIYVNTGTYFDAGMQKEITLFRTDGGELEDLGFNLGCTANDYIPEVVIDYTTQRYTLVFFKQKK